MVDSSSNRTQLPTKRTFGPNPSHVHDSLHTLSNDQPARRTVSFDYLPRKPNFISRWRASRTEENVSSSIPHSDRPPIPNALTQATEINATPLPILSMIVLSIAMLGEFLSANVSAPFLLFMVDGFGGFSDEADVGFWTGILASCFFLTQFLTSLLWATVADKHGQRLVLFISLLGSAVTCFLFGTSTTMNQAIVIRLLQGIFAGAVGVARGCVTVITDQSNEGRAYSILGFCWGLGGVAGAIIGATFESPAKKWPASFVRVPFFVNYPYVLPCLIASSMTLIGAFLSLFLGPDGGRREGAIRLADKEINQPPSPMMEDIVTLAEDTNSLGSRITKRFSAYFARSPRAGLASTSDQPLSVPLSPTATRATFRTSRVNGSAYGYTGSYRNRPANDNGFSTQRGSSAVSFPRRRNSNTLATSNYPAGDSGELNFTQRLLMANENAVTNISDLWVSAAMNVDNEEPLDLDMDLEGSYSNLDLTPHEYHDDPTIDRPMSTPSHIGSRLHSGISSHMPSTSSGQLEAVASPRNSPHRGRRSVSRRVSATRGHVADDPPGFRRLSSTSIPTIFSHSGVRTPPAILEAQQQLLSQTEDNNSLEPISESTTTVELSEKPLSLYSQLPFVIIVHYGLLALHSTTHDQVFYLYLVSKYQSGGLNLNAGHFGQLVALMCFCQIVYQFYLYPNMGPPRGRFSHLAMFRLGSILFIPAYLTVILYRTFASAEGDGDFILMTALALSTAIRYCGSTFCYTSISVLLNYMSPPHVVGFANGVAQSIVSFSRFLGPIVGGTLWSMSVEHNPEGYSLGFLVCAGICALAVCHSIFIR